MRKTNSKEVKAAVRKYLLESCEESIVDLKQRMLEEKRWEVNHYGMQQACEDWLRGLATEIDYETYKIVPIMAEWLNESEDDAWKYVEQRGDDLYWTLVAREIVASK